LLLTSNRASGMSEKGETQPLISSGIAVLYGGMGI